MKYDVEISAFMLTDISNIWSRIYWIIRLLLMYDVDGMCRYGIRSVFKMSSNNMKMLL